MTSPARKKIIAASVLAVLGFPAAAQDSALVLEEVVVTAQKRNETLAETPMSVSVVSAAQIADFATFSLQEINNLTTGLAISGGGVDFDLAVRGLGSDLNAPLVPRLTFYVDGNYFHQPRGLLTGLFDIAQMEVLRGPQGTLYGQTSPAGALTIRSTDPNLEEFDGYLRQTFNDRDGSNSQLAASLPIIKDKLGVRVAGLYDTNENPDIENITRDSDVENETTAFRVVALWRPVDNFDLRVAYWDIEDDNDIDPMVEGSGLDVDDRKAVADTRSNFENKTDMWSVEANYTFANDWTLSFVASDQDQRIIRDYDEDASDVFAQRIVVDSPVDTQTYELRLASQDNDFWDWTAGAFYFEATTVTEVTAETITPVFPGFTVFTSTDGPADLDSDTWAVFTHNSIHLTDKGTLTLGLRYSETNRENEQPFNTDVFRLFPDGSLQFLISLPQIDGVLPEDQKGDDEAVTGTLKYQHQFTDPFMVYASYDRGWVAGSANIAGGPQPPVFGAFEAEESDNFELGFKWEILGGRGLWNFAAYYQLYTDFHFNAETVSFREPGGTIGQESPVVNVDEAESYGFDTDFTVLLSDNWTLRAGLSYNQAELSDAKDTPCTNNEPIGTEDWAFNTCDLSGERAGAEPEWSANLSSEFFMPTGGNMEWYIRGLFNVESEYYSLSEAKDLDSYALLDLYFGLRAADRTWDATIWVKNVTDESALLKTETRIDIPDLNAGTTVDNPYTWIRRSLDPRTMGVTLNYNF